VKSAGTSGKKREYLKVKIMSLQQTITTRTSKTCTEEKDKCKNGCKPRNNIVKDENGDQFEDSHINSYF
jgi:hypothetical protein